MKSVEKEMVQVKDKAKHDSHLILHDKIFHYRRRSFTGHQTLRGSAGTGPAMRRFLTSAMMMGKVYISSQMFNMILTICLP